MLTFLPLQAPPWGVQWPTWLPKCLQKGIKMETNQGCRPSRNMRQRVRIAYWTLPAEALFCARYHWTHFSSFSALENFRGGPLETILLSWGVSRRLVDISKAFCFRKGTFLSHFFMFFGGPETGVKKDLPTEGSDVRSVHAGACFVRVGSPRFGSILTSIFEPFWEPSWPLYCFWVALGVKSVHSDPSKLPLWGPFRL